MNIKKISIICFIILLNYPVNAELIKGTTEDDYLSGTNKADTIYGKNSNDILYGNGGDDTLYGGQGDDKLCGGSGKNLLYQHLKKLGVGFHFIIYCYSYPLFGY